MTKEISILNIQGNAVGQIALDEKVFGIEPNVHVMHLALRRQLNNGRAGTASAKTRAEVSGGGRKPWKQKGTGRARAGSIRSPLFAGGGVSFGPKPRDYSFSMPQKARKLALKSALSARVENTIIVKDFSEVNEPKTKIMANTLKALKAVGKVLIIADDRLPENGYLKIASRNMPNVRVILPTNLNVKDLLEANSVIITENSIKEITERLS